MYFIPTFEFICAQFAGTNSHHIIEATFKAFARALRQATEYDTRRRGTIPRSSISQTNIYFILYEDKSNMNYFAASVTSKLFTFSSPSRLITR
jgi:hypothetical protein